MVSDYEKAIARLNELTSAEGTSAALRDEATLFQGEAAWSLGRWGLAFDSFAKCSNADSKYGLHCSHSRFLAAVHAYRQTRVATETDAHGKTRLSTTPILDPHNVPGVGALVVPARRVPFGRDAERVVAAVKSHRLLLASRSHWTQPKNAARLARVEFELAVVLAEHRHTPEATLQLNLARDRWRDLLRMVEGTTHERKPDFEGLAGVLSGAQPVAP